MYQEFYSDKSSSQQSSVILFGFFALITFSIWMFGINQYLFYAINHLHIMLPDRVWNGLNFIAYSKYFILPSVLLIICFLLRKDKVINTTLLIVLFYGIFWLIKHFTHEARPYAVLPVDSFFWLNSFEDSKHVAYMSFPSGHTGNMAIFVFAANRLFFSQLKFVRILLIILLTLVGLARVCTGWHWPIDVIASGLIAYLLVRLVRV